MANSKELQALIDNLRGTPSNYQFDLSLLDGEVYKELMMFMVSQDDFLDAQKKRNSMVHSAKIMIMQNPHNPALVSLIKKIKEYDRRTADTIYAAFVQSAVSAGEVGKKLTNAEWRELYMKTEEDKKNYNDFVRLTNEVAFILDIASGFLSDAYSALHKINAETELPEFDGVKQAMKAIKSYCYQDLRENHPKINELFCEYSDSIGPYLDKRFSTFEKKLKVLRAELKAKGEIKKGTKDIKATDY